MTTGSSVPFRQTVLAKKPYVKFAISLGGSDFWIGRWGRGHCEKGAKIINSFRSYKQFPFSILLAPVVGHRLFFSHLVFCVS